MEHLCLVQGHSRERDRHSPCLEEPLIWGTLVSQAASAVPAPPPTHTPPHPGETHSGALNPESWQQTAQGPREHHQLGRATECAGPQRHLSLCRAVAPAAAKQLEFMKKCLPSSFLAAAGTRREGVALPSPLGIQLGLSLCPERRCERRELFPLFQPGLRHLSLERAARGGGRGGAESPRRHQQTCFLSLDRLPLQPAVGAPQTLPPPARARASRLWLPRLPRGNSPCCSVPAEETQLHVPVFLSKPRGAPSSPSQAPTHHPCPPSPSLPRSAPPRAHTGNHESSHSCTHSRTHSRTHMHTVAHTHAHTRAHTCTRGRTRMYALAHTHAHMGAGTSALGVCRSRGTPSTPESAAGCGVSRGREQRSARPPLGLGFPSTWQVPSHSELTVSPGHVGSWSPSSTPHPAAVRVAL